jgi:hypothetical protein
MGRFDILPFKPPIRDDQYSCARLNHADYYFVDHGFFKLRTNLNGTLFTLLTLTAAVGYYRLFSAQLWPLMFICEFHLTNIFFCL